jgi:hypothetical protein
LLLYGIDVRKVSRLTGWLPSLEKVTMQKFRTSNADAVKELVISHHRLIDETVDEVIQQGMTDLSQALIETEMPIAK